MREIKTDAATLLDLAEMAGHAHASRLQWAVMREVFDDSQTWAIRHEGRLVGLAGLAPIGPGQAESWFHFWPEASALMLPIVRAIRLTLAAAPYRAIVTLCTSEAGSRICRAAGFVFAERSEHGEVWAYAGSSGRGPREAGNGEPAAHVAGAAGSAAGGD